MFRLAQYDTSERDLSAPAQILERGVEMTTIYKKVALLVIYSSHPDRSGGIPFIVRYTDLTILDFRIVSDSLSFLFSSF